ncbi:MAG TPA: bifunctional diaminohydroxyphosphoribosylaminopyrimidine deaminase/5-amino-6-(5-phosphoribosylamino)uracil reductase RibD [Nitrospiraceae bacterium]|nr:bifunctional diaminohydroxyphosphoribosylaminopyrimidine deaminase/5-amino-6-(5-phosphoribosylamino)uracil reductase RibD [Nitrospiraceae bacterium]
MNRQALDRRYMTLALRLATKGLGRTSPNPMVGAVVVSKGRIVGRGYHRKAGGPHAEVLALRQAGRRARGGTLYVTLEPCSHTNKRTPPCVPLVIASQVRRVVVAMVDPNPLVKGRGIRQLRQAGIQVDLGCCRERAEALNAAYCHWITTGRPFVILKAGMTLDGKIATASGEAKWITGDAARRHVHRLRSRVDAIMVGIGTILRDDPELTARIGGRAGRLAVRQPLRVVVDSRLRLPLDARVTSVANGVATLVAATTNAPRAKLAQLEARGIEVLTFPGRDGRVPLPTLLAALAKRGITSLLLEGGSELNASALRAGLVDRVMLYVAPRLLGGRDAIGLIGGPSPARLGEAVVLHRLSVRKIGEDRLIQGDVCHV